VDPERPRADRGRLALVREDLGGFGWSYLPPSSVRARCGGHTLAVQPLNRRWTLFRLFSGGLRASSPLARGNGWVERGTPPIPTS